MRKNHHHQQTTTTDVDTLPVGPVSGEEDWEIGHALYQALQSFSMLASAFFSFSPLFIFFFHM